MIMPLVTIAIPFFNDERYLSSAIQSVINQTYNNWELLLIDDGSRDRSIEIARSFSIKDERISLIVDGNNYGLAVRLNQSVELAKGVFYARMDADDIMVNTRIEKQIIYFKLHPETDVLGSSAMIIDDSNNIIRSCDMSGVMGGFIHPTVMGRIEWFRKYLYCPRCKRCQDVELWLRSRNNSVFFNMIDPLLFYREIGVQSLKKNLESHKAYRDIVSNYKLYDKSFFWYIKSICLSYIRDFVYIAFSKLGYMEVLTHVRKRKPLPKELNLGQQDLEVSIMSKNNRYGK